jgi:hypothetical protein
LSRNLLWLAVLLLAAPASELAAQQQRGVEPADTADIAGGPSPRGAFVRSLVLPGWGQLYVGTPRRAAVFIGLQTTSYAMLAHSMRRLDDIRTDERRRVGVARDSILLLAEQDTALARRIEDTLEFDALVAADPAVASARDLERARRRHRQDWITYTIVFTMASAIDAYVSAHLSGFPGTITAEPRPDGAAVRISVPAGRRP